MIQTRTDLKKYLFEDKRANIYAYGVGVFCYLKHCLGNTDAYRVYKYLKALRYYEYWLNKSNQKTVLCLRTIYKIISGICKLRLSRRSAKYNINVCRPNSLGYGFRITHIY